MRHSFCILLCVLVAAGYAVVLPAVPGGAAAPPLSLDGYRDEKLPTGRHESAGLKELNGACYVCHGNYRTEALVLRHAQENVGCVKCHGESLPHQVDEFHRTPPEKMYAARDVDRMCGTCHEEHNVTARQVIRRWQERCAAKTDPTRIVCTDCHFAHRLASRTVVWDRQTGKLIVHKPGEDTSQGKK